MKTLLLLALAAAALFPGRLFCRIKTDLEENGLKGPVRAQCVYNYTLNLAGTNYTPEKVLSISTIIYYDRDGFFCNSEGYDISNTLVFRVESVFDPTNKTREICGYDMENGLQSIQYRHAYQYRAKAGGDIIKADSVVIKVYNKQGEVICTHHYSYNDRGDWTEWVLLDNKGRTNIARKWKYDDAGNVVEETSSEKDLGDYKRAYTYDKRGNVIEINKYSSGAKPMARELRKYVYEGSGLKSTEISCFDTNTCYFRKVYKYDRGNVSEIVEYEGDQPSSRSEYAYDSRGNITREIRYETSEDAGGKKEVMTEYNEFVNYYWDK